MAKSFYDAWQRFAFNTGTTTYMRKRYARIGKSAASDT
jgi:hypothetical protein